MQRRREEEWHDTQPVVVLPVRGSINCEFQTIAAGGREEDDNNRGGGRVRRRRIGWGGGVGSHSIARQRRSPPSPPQDVMPPSTYASSPIRCFDHCGRTTIRAPPVPRRDYDDDCNKDEQSQRQDWPHRQAYAPSGRHLRGRIQLRVRQQRREVPVSRGIPIDVSMIGTVETQRARVHGVQDPLHVRRLSLLGSRHQGVLNRRSHRRHQM